MTDYGVDAREQHTFIGNLRGPAATCDVAVELTPEQQRLVAPTLARLPEDGSGVAIGQVFDGGYEDELPAPAGGPRTFLFLRVLTGERARAVAEAVRAAMALPE